ncbi:DAHL domain-containing protein, partial [Sulfurimonas sp.]|uniref:DAHL domain-containing protein n=1 Tax=Sulfurimonas sp. TaxID=2022749 RepID=UPI00262D44B4
MQLLKKIDKVVFLLLSSLVMLVVLFSYLVLIDKDTKEYNIIHDKIVALKITDKKLDNFALTIDVFKNYNCVNKSTTTFKNTLNSLGENLSAQYPKNLELTQCLHNIKKTFATKVDNLEYFKSLNATLINTSHFLFDLQQTLRESKNISQQTKSSVNETLFYLLKFTTTDYIDNAFINKQLENVLKLSKEEHNSLIYNFYTHSKLMLKTLSELKKLSLEIRTSKLYQQLQKLHMLVDSIHNKNLQINRAITLLFFLTAFGLILILLKVYRKSVKISQELYAFQFAVKNSDNSVVLTDSQRHITFVNEVFEKMTGYSKEEALGQNPNILKSGKQDDSFYVEL